MTTSAITLEASPRTKDARAKDLRKESRVPGVLYGYKVDNQTLECDYQSFHKVFKKAGESTVIDLKVGDRSVPVLIHQVDLDPVTDKYEHVDFFAPDMTKEVTAHIPINTIGEAPGVKDQGGILISQRSTITVKCLPKDLPHEVVVDISSLENFHDTITVSDISLGDKVKIQHEDSEILLTVQPPRQEEEETPVVAEGEEGATAEGGAGAEGAEDEKKGGEGGGEKPEDAGEEKK